MYAFQGFKTLDGVQTVVNEIERLDLTDEDAKWEHVNVDG